MIEKNVTQTPQDSPQESVKKVGEIFPKNEENQHWKKTYFKTRLFPIPGNSGCPGEIGGGNFKFLL